jgi:7-cyano-7-deazaguanine synthase
MGLVLLSGGLDSTTVAALACSHGWQLSALTLSYGQVHSREVDSAARVARELRLSHRIIDVSFYRELAWYSALTRPGSFVMPTGRSTEAMAAEVPVTYVPLRNMFFLTLAAAWLESEALQAIERDGVAPVELETAIFIAVNAIDYSGYPDCRPEFYDAMATSLRLGSKLGAQYGVAFRLETPLIHMTKAEIVRLAVGLRAPIHLTWSCYAGGERPCGTCDSCTLRAKGFAEAGLADPALATA